MQIFGIPKWRTMERKLTQLEHSQWTNFYQRCHNLNWHGTLFALDMCAGVRRQTLAALGDMMLPPARLPNNPRGAKLWACRRVCPPSFAHLWKPGLVAPFKLKRRLACQQHSCSLWRGRCQKREPASVVALADRERVCFETQHELGAQQRSAKGLFEVEISSRSLFSSSSITSSCFGHQQTRRHSSVSSGFFQAGRSSWRLLCVCSW